MCCILPVLQKFIVEIDFKKRHIIILENLVVNARRTFNNDGYIPTMNNSSIDNWKSF